MLWSVAKSGDTATPRRPPSPSGLTPGTVPSTLGGCPARTCRSLPSSRSVTSADPSGRKARPHGTSRSVAMVAVAGARIGLGLGLVLVGLVVAGALGLADVL